MKKSEVVDRCQNRAQHLPGEEQVAQVRAAETAARQARAVFLDRSRIAPVRRVPQSYVTFVGKTSCITSITSRHDAIEKVDTGGYGIEDVLRAADAHQVARSIGREEVCCYLESLTDEAGAFTHADTANRVTIEILGDQGFGAFSPKIRVRAALYYAEECLIGATVAVCTEWPRRSYERRPRRYLLSRQAAGAMIEAHGYVGAELFLDRDGPLGGKLERLRPSESGKLRHGRSPGFARPG